MKPRILNTACLSLPLATALAALLAVSSANSATLYWDSNGTGTAGAGATPTGNWGGSAFWSTDATGANVGAPVLTAVTTNADDLFFVAGPGAASGNNAYTVTVTGAQVANSLTFQASGATTLSGGTSITLGNGTPGAGGITMNQFAYGSTAQGAVTISTALSLANSQTWTNNSASLLTFSGGVTLGSTLTFAGTGNFSATAGSFGNAGAGGIIMNGTGVLNVRAATNTNYTGSTTINSGIVLLNAGSKSTGNFNLAGGMVTDYFQQTGIFSSGLGAGANQIQITGNSGFGAGNGTSIWRIGTASSVLIWGASGEGAATGFFNPTTLKFMTAADNLGPTIYGNVNFDNGLNLNGATRTIDVFMGSNPAPTNSGASIAGVISNGSLIKTGAGNLTLANAGNSWAGTTTISGGFLTVAATGALGSASNTLEFNGGTLRATGTVTSPSTRAVTMTATGIIDTNAQAISIAGNIGGAGGLTKNSTGTLTLSGTNSYGGVTTVNAGTLAITKEASLASNTAANLNVKSGAGLALNVDSTGAAGFTVANLDTLLGNILVANTSTQGLQKGAILSLDTGATTFTLGNAITNSTGASGGSISLIKLGSSTLVLEDANTYNGATTISAGTLQLNAGGVIATAIGNNATFAVNSAGAVTQGTHFGLIGGTGSLTKTLGGTLTLNLANTFSGMTTVSAGTLALTNGLALQNSALATTSGTSTYSGGAALTIGGLSGATGDLGSANVLNGYTGTVTALTLNPQIGVSVTYGGNISDGSGAMSLTKTGAGTQILTGANGYTGATIVNAGTLTIGAGGSLNSLSALQINGGTFSYGNSSAGQTLNGLAVGAGNSTVNNTATGQTLTLGAITRTASIFGTVNFATLTSPISTSTTNTNGIIGPWATTGSTTTLRYAVGAGNISGLTGTTATANTLANVTDATVNYEYSAAVAGMGAGLSLTGNTLRYSGAATTTAINATSTLTLNGLMQAGTGLLTISGGPSTGGILIGSTGELVIAANAQATTISATIGGTGRLVYSGGAGALSLSSLTNAYTGGTVINSGTLTLTGTANSNVDSVLGNASGGITLNGGRLQGTSVNINGARIVTVNGVGSSMLVNKNNNFATTGKLTGDGALTTVDAGGNGTLSTYSFNSTLNDYTGRLFSGNTIVNVNSFADSTNNIVLDSGNFNYGTGATGATSLTNRAIELSGSTGGGTINNNNTTAANTLSFGKDLLVTGVGNKQLTLGGANFGANTFSGKITDGPGSVISLGVNGANWIVSGNNTYSGQTTVAGSTGATLTLSGDNSGMIGNVVLSTSTGTATSAPRLNINSATALGTGLLNFGGGAATDVVRIDNTNASAVIVSTANAINMGRDFTFVGTRDLNLGTGAITLSGMLANTSRNITVTANTLTLAGAIGDGTNGLSGITKVGAGTLVLSNTNNYSGLTTASVGTLIAGSNSPSGSAGAFGNASSEIGLGAAGGSSNASLLIGGAFNVGRNVRLATSDTTDAGTRVLTLGGNTAHNSEFSGNIFLGTASQAGRGVTLTAASGGQVTFSGVIQNPGSMDATTYTVTKAGAGTVVLSNSNTYTGSTAVTDGILKLDHLTALPGGIALAGGTNNLTISGGGIVGLTANSGNFLRGLGIGVTQVQFTGSGGYAAYGGDRTVNLGNTGATAQWGSGSFVTGGSSLILSAADADGTLIWANPINFAGSVRTIQVNNGSAAVDARLTAALGVSGGANGGLNKTGLGKLQTTADNIYVGATTVAAGTLELGNNGLTGRLSATTSISVASGATLSINRSDAFSQATDLGAGVAITGDGGFTQAGGGTTTLTATNTYTGATAVNAGKLVVGVAGVGSITSNVTVASSATLGGSGSINGNIILNAESALNAKDGGRLAPGNSPGVLTATGTTTLNTGSIFAWTIDTDVGGGLRGTEYAGLNTDSVSGTTAAVFQIVTGDSEGFADNFWDTNHDWTDIFKNDTGATSLTTDWSTVFSSFAYSNGTSALATPTNGSFTWTNTGNTLSWTAVPEPTSALAGLLIAAGLLRRRRNQSPVVSGYDRG